MARKVVDPPAKPNPTAVRFRAGLLDFLRAEAKHRGMTVNALINEIVGHHMHWRAGMARRKAG